MTPAGIEPATFRFVAQHLNHCATAVPDQITLEDMKVLTATPSSDKGPRMSKRKKKPPTTKSKGFLW